MPPAIENLINKYVRMKADWWINGTHIVRQKIRKGFTLDKTVSKKNVGRLLRLFFKNEALR